MSFLQEQKITVHPTHKDVGSVESAGAAFYLNIAALWHPW